jgi:hypothetical protein
MEKQTAVEWLEDKIQSDMTFIEILGLIRQVKEMEKQQIINAYDCGKEQPLSSQLSPIEYYNETFGGKDII